MTHAFSGHVLKAQYIKMIHMSVIQLKHTCLSDIQSDDDDDQPILWAESVTLSSYRSRDFFISRALLFCVKDFIMSGWMIDTRDWPWENTFTEHPLQSNNQLTETHQNYTDHRRCDRKNHRNNNQGSVHHFYLFVVFTGSFWLALQCDKFNLKCTCN